MLGWRSARGRAVLVGAVFMLLLATVAGIAVWRARDDQQRNEHLERRSTVVTALDDARAQLYLGATWVASSAIAEDPALFYDLNRQAEQALREGLAQARTELVALGETNELASLDEESRQIDDLVQELDVLWEFSLTADSDARIETAQAELDRLWPRAVVVMGDLGQLAEDQQSELADERAAAERATNVTLWLLLGFSAAALVTGAAAVTTIGVSVARPLASLRASVRAIASGNLHLTASVSGPEEVASLARDVNAMTEALLERREGLQDSREKYRYLFEDLTDAAFVADANTGILLDTNRQAEALLGRTREEIIGMHQSKLHPPGRAEEYKQRFAAHVEKARKADYDGEVVTKDGRLVPVSISATTTAVVDGKRLTIGLFRDITERKRAEEALREAKEFAEGLVASMLDGFSVLDSRGVHVDVNAAFCRMTGFSREELIGTGPPYPYWPPEEHAKTEEAFEKTLRGEFDDLELTFMRKNGQRFPVIISPSWLKDRQGNVVSYFATVKDITERKQAEEALRESEERFRRLSESAFEGIAIHDKGRILEANQAFERMFGYELSEVIGMSATDLAAPESRDLVSQNISSGHREPFEAIGLRKDGSTFPCLVRARPIPYQGRAVSVTAIRDISELKRAEEELQKAREELEAKVEHGMQRGNPYRLTFRELTVLHLIAAGRADKEIGLELGISPQTAQKHVANILGKMDAASRTEAGVRAVREGLLD